MRQRLITAIFALAALGVVLFVLPAKIPKIVEVVIAALILAGAWEWSAFLGSSSTTVRAAYVVLIAALLAAFSVGFPGSSEQLLLVSLVWWLSALIWIFFYPTPIPGLVRWLGGILVLVPLHVALLILYDVGPTLLVFALLVVWVADSGAYVAGKRFGRVKLAPRISPGKTWEGVIGGLAAVILLTIGRTFWVDADLAVWVPFCLAVASLSIVGDLTVSMFKRTAGLKDSGTLFPGHGGVLDRVDSIAAAAPLFALGIIWAGLR